MPVRADYDPKYFRRFLLIAVGCIAFTGWCFYDALVKYPAELERAVVYWEESDEYGEKYEGMERTRWREVVADRNWPTAPPRKPDKIEKAITSQYFYAAICLLIGIPCLFKWFTARGSWIEGSDTELTTSWGSTIAYKDIEKLDKTKWERKGITRIHHQSGGNPGIFIFDDFKFNRARMSEILTRIEEGLKDEQIEGGDRETEIVARKEKAKQEKARKEAEFTADLHTDEPEPVEEDSSVS